MPSRELEVLAAVLAGTTPTTLVAPVEEQRVAYDAVALVYPPDDAVTVEEVDAGGVPGELVTAPGSRADVAVLHLHGGGYGIGSPAGYRGTAARLSAAAGAPVLVPAYRLAPEHDFPAAVDDAGQAYRWLLERVGAPGRLAVCGDSAGGGLAVAILSSARHDLPVPAALALWSPWVDLAVAEDRGEGVRDPVLSVAWLRERAAAYLDGADATDPRASPVLAPLGGLPPTLVLVGSEEILLADARRLTEAARAAGAEVSLEEVAGAIHLWMHLAPQAEESLAAFARTGRFLADRLAPPPAA